MLIVSFKTACLELLHALSRRKNAQKNSLMDEILVMWLQLHKQMHNTPAKVCQSLRFIPTRAHLLGSDGLPTVVTNSGFCVFKIGVPLVSLF